MEKRAHKREINPEIDKAFKEYKDSNNLDRKSHQNTFKAGYLAALKTLEEKDDS